MHKKNLFTIIAVILLMTVLASAIIFVGRFAVRLYVQQKEYIGLNEERAVWFDNYVIDSSILS